MVECLVMPVHRERALRSVLRGLPDQKFAAEEQSSLVGVDPRKYPRDFGVFVRYNPELKRTIPARYPIPPALALADFEEFLTESPEQYRITWR